MTDIIVKIRPASSIVMTVKEDLMFGRVICSSHIWLTLLGKAYCQDLKSIVRQDT